MPKVLVLLVDDDPDAAHVAAAVLDGAAGVRFTEVELRSTSSCEPVADRRCRQLESADHVLEYDGLILVAADARSTGVATFVQDAETLPSGAFANIVIGIIYSRGVDSIDAVARIGGILVTPPARVTDPATAAQLVAARVARVSAWVRHSLDHEHHDHHHDRQHHDHDHLHHVPGVA